MKVISLEASNIKRLVAVQISPDENMVEITGKNGQGKTSVLDAIWWALAGTGNVQATPVRRGEEFALIKLDLGDLKVTRKFIAKEDGTHTTSLNVENGEGARYQSPQEILNKLVGELTFDPLAFSRMKGPDRVRALRSLVPDFDFEANESSRKQAFTTRTDHNRDAKRFEAAAVELAKTIPEDTPDEFEDVAALARELQSAQEHNAKQGGQQQSIDQHGQAISNTRDALEKAKMEVERLEEILKEHEANLDTLAKPEPFKNTDAILKRLEVAESAQGVRQAVTQRDKAVSDAKTAQKESEALTLKIERLKREEREAIANAKLPVEGITIEDDEIHLAELPFDQASDAEQLRASVAIAMAMNPKLRIIRVRDGSLLDEDAMQIMREMADSNDFQVWIERVDSSGKVGIVMEEGRIKGQVIEETKEPEPVEETPAPETAPTPRKKKSLFDKD